MLSKLELRREVLMFAELLELHLREIDNRISWDKETLDQSNMKLGNEVKGIFASMFNEQPEWFKEHLLESAARLMNLADRSGLLR